MIFWNRRSGRKFFGVPPKRKEEQTGKFLQKLAKQYKESKSRERNQNIKSRSSQLQQPIKIAGTKHGSTIAFQGATPSTFKTRIEAAKNLGRVRSYAAERRRLLSIVACDFSQTLLTELFQCSKATVTAARVHSILFGRGGVPPSSMKFICQCISQEVLDDLAEFLLRDNVQRPSSCRSVIVEGEECPVRYWQDSIKNSIQQYRLEFPNGIRCTYIYTHLPKNFRSNTMLAGLCNICEDCGYSNFAMLISLLQRMALELQDKT